MEKSLLECSQSKLLSRILWCSRSALTRMRRMGLLSARLGGIAAHVRSVKAVPGSATSCYSINKRGWSQPLSRIRIAAAPGQRAEVAKGQQGPAADIRAATEPKERALPRTFLANLEHTKAFVQEHGHLPCGYMPARQPQLEAWLKALRLRHKNGKLSAPGIKALNDAFGNAWQYNASESRYTEMLQHLRSFIEVHGRLPKQVEPAFQGEELGSWVHSQRHLYQAGRLPQERAAALESIPGWVWKEQDVCAFREYLAALREFSSTKGRLPQTRETYGGKKLGCWMKYQRVKYHAKTLSAEHIQALESVPGWAWSGTKLVTFALGLQTVKAWVQANGCIPGVADIDTVAGFHVGSWVSRQRWKKKQGLLSPEEVAALDGVPGWWWTKKGA